MNILFYMTRYPGWGGIEKVTSLIVDKLSVKGNIIILSHLQQSMFVEENPSIMLYTMPDKHKWVTSANCEFAEYVVTRHKIDTIIYQDSYAPTEKIVCEIAHKYGIDLFVFEHNSPLFIMNKRDLESIMTLKGCLRRVFHKYLLIKEIKRKQYLLSHSKRYVLLSKNFIPEFCELTKCNINDKRVTFINNPIQSLPKSQTDKENIILCVCRLTKEKCVDAMLDMWKLACYQLLDWRFVIVGDGRERCKLESKVCKESIPRVEFTGFIDPTEYYKRSKIFLMTSKYEGWGMTLVEAMQQGCVPLVWHSFSSVTDIIDNEINGFIVPNKDTSAFLSTLMTLAKNPTIFSQMSKASMEKVKFFEVDEILKDWYKLLGIGN